MKLEKTLPFAVVPVLLISSSLATWLAIQNSWNFELVSYLIFLFSVFYISIFERISPLKPHWKLKRQSLKSDLKHLFLSAGIFDALGKMSSLALVIFLHKQFFEPAGLWQDFHFLATFLIANVIGELLPYIYHRFSHTAREGSTISWFLWKVHAIHHLPTTMNWLKASWIHPINMFLNSVLKMAPLLLLGFSEEILFAVGVMHIVVAYISHANINTRTGFLDYLIVTPQLHHFHHSKLLNEAKNFGSTIPFWDIVFGTYYNRKGLVEEIGIFDSSSDYPENNRYLQQLTFPFSRMFRGCCSGG